MAENIARGTSGVTLIPSEPVLHFTVIIQCTVFFPVLYTEELQDQEGADIYAKMKN